MKNYTNYTVTKTSTSTGNVILMEEFKSEKEAMSFFKAEVKHYGYQIEERDNGFLKAGGYHADFEIELQWDNFG